MEVVTAWGLGPFRLLDCETANSFEYEFRWDEERKMSCVKNVLFALFNTITWLVSECVALAAPLDYIDCENLF